MKTDLPSNIAANLLLIPDHMREGMALYLAFGLEPGQFLVAVLSNDLREACGRADLMNRYRIFDFVEFLYSYAPSACWGSPKNVAAWIERGGLNGRPAKGDGE